MLKSARRLSIIAAHPLAGHFDHVHLSIRIVRKAMPARLVMGTGSLYRGIVLRDMEIDGPRAQRVRDAADRLAQRLLLRPVEILGQDAVFGSVVAERE